jgi:uncharacterized protein (DUF779 family)
LNYVSMGVLRWAAMMLEMERQIIEQEEPPEGTDRSREALEEWQRQREEVMVHGLFRCGWQQDPLSEPCFKTAEYLIADGTRVSAGGDIEAAPQWICREHLEEILGHAPIQQPIFHRIERPED